MTRGKITILRMMRYRLLFIFTILSLYAHGQIVNADGRGIIFNEETTIDLRLHTNGWAVGVNRGDLEQYNLTKFQSLEIGEIRHSKQDKRTFDLLSFGSNVVNRSFVYGKQNNLYFAKYSVGRKRYFTEKSERKGVAFGITYSGGPVLGLVKPYMLDVFVREVGPSGAISRDLVAIRYDGTNDDIFLDQNNINGPAGWTNGWRDVKIQPGLQGKIALHFDWGAFDKFVKGLEMGMMVDLFFRKVPIMIIEDNKQVFMNFYVNAHFGRRK